MENGRYMPVVVPYQSMGAIVHILDTRTGEYVPQLTLEEQTKRNIVNNEREALIQFGIVAVVVIGGLFAISMALGKRSMKNRASRIMKKEDAESGV